MRFQVPQFIEVEDKVFGPLTVKQFVYLIGGAGLCYMIYYFMGIFLGFFFIIPVAALSLALAFYRVNDKPFVYIMEAAFKYFISEKLYIWKKEDKKQTERKPEQAITEAANSFNVPRLSGSKLKELSWSLDINEKLNK